MIEKTRYRLTVCVTLLLFAAAVACASDSSASQESILHTTLVPSDIATPISSEVSNPLAPVSNELAGLSRELLRPPIEPVNLVGIDANLVKSLPAAPTAIVTVAMGFLCVSLVKDRRVWLTVAAGLLWAGQTGINILPQLVAQISIGHMKQKCPVESFCLQPLENIQRLRSDIEGTQYIGLLHYLAGIPDSKCAFKKPSFTQSRFRLNSIARDHQPKTFHAGLIPVQNDFATLCKCPAENAERFISFSPAFIFERIPRGPPSYT